MSSKTILAFVFLLNLLLCPIASGQLKFPDTPYPGQLVQDYADVISAEDKKVIQEIQYQLYENEDTPICVVTIPSKRTFGGQNVSIEKVAHDLFDKWEIGKRDADGKLINQGILLLVSIGDRKARIELGADWRRDWDAHCDIIMNESIVPKFKAGKYSDGILTGVKRLAEMGNSGPEGSAPISWSNKLNAPMIKDFNELPRWAGIVLIAVGLGLILSLIHI